LKEKYPDNIRPTIIALTANATQADKERSLEAGMDGHISKPILPNILAEVMGSIKPKRGT
jgi:CheY-like chemotaxis protein